jgi:hypothetical protein
MTLHASARPAAQRRPGAPRSTWRTPAALVGTGDLSTALSVGSEWVINPAVAEWVIRRRSLPGSR